MVDSTQPSLSVVRMSCRAWFRLFSPSRWLRRRSDVPQLGDLRHHGPAHMSIKLLACVPLCISREVDRFPIRDLHRTTPDPGRSDGQGLVRSCDIGRDHRAGGFSHNDTDPWSPWPHPAVWCSATLWIDHHHLAALDEANRFAKSFSVQPVRPDRNPPEPLKEPPKPGKEILTS